MIKPAPDAHRTLHKTYAYLNNYFWLPCPRCGKMFGGHERVGTIAIRYAIDSQGNAYETYGQGTCCPKKPDEKPTNRQLADAWMLADMRVASGEELA